MHPTYGAPALFPLPLPLPPVHPHCRSRRRLFRFYAHSSAHSLAIRAIFALNRLYGPTYVQSSSPTPVRNVFSPSPPSSAQTRLLSRILSLCHSFVLASRQPALEACSDRADSLFLCSYQPSLSSAVPIVASRVSLPSTTPTASMTALLPPHLAHLYSSPRSILSTSFHSLVRPPPPARIYGQRAEYVQLLRRMMSAGLLTTTRRPQAINGVFCVTKPDSDQLRVIIDARPANSCFEPPSYVDLPSPELLGRLSMRAHSSWYVGKTDLSNFFHSVLIPDWLSSYFALPPVLPSELGICDTDTHSPVYPCCRTLPMGWAHSVFIAQAIHERLLSGLPSVHRNTFLRNASDTVLDRLRVMVYVDDCVWLDTDRARARRAVAEYVTAMRQVGLPINDKKVVVPDAAPLRVLGFLLDPCLGRIAFDPQHMGALIRLTRAVCSAPQVTARGVSVLLGKWVWVSLVCRSALSVLSAVFAFAARCDRKPQPMWPSARHELETMCDLAPLLCARVPAPPFTRVLATDASMLGGAVMQASVSPALAVHLVSAPLKPAPHLASAPLSLPPLTPTPSSSRLMPLYAFPSAVLSRVSSVRWRHVFRFRWRAPAHINEYELQSLLLALRWALTFPASCDTSLVTCIDSMVAAYCVLKGRSSSFPLLCVLRRIGACCLASGISIRPIWLASADNPADQPSRDF